MKIVCVPNGRLGLGWVRLATNFFNRAQARFDSIRRARANNAKVVIRIWIVEGLE